MKKKLILMCIAGALLMTAVIGGTLAGFNTEINEQGSAEITVDKFDIGVTGTGILENGSSEVISLETAATPGGKVSIERTIANNGSYDLYVRIVINKKWDIDKSAETIQLIFDNSASEWISISDSEQVIMYYKWPVAKGATVDLPLTGISFPTSLNNDYAGKSVNFDIRVDAVQAAVVKDAMLSEWGVLPVFKGDTTEIEYIQE